MRVFAIADLHLSKADPKPMDVFGPGWEGHPQVLFDGWRSVVREQDLVLVPGDVSWALKLEAALKDLHEIDALPGRKVLLRGNHDYWWPSASKLRRHLPPRVQAIHNDALRIGDVVVAGTRGWICPGAPEFGEEDVRLYRRELDRLDLSLRAATRMRQAGDRVVVMLHYPPTNARAEASGFSERIQAFRPDVLTYGHVHGGEAPEPYPFEGIRTVFAAADALQFVPASLFSARSGAAGGPS